MSNDNVSKNKKQSQKLHFDTKSVRNNIIYVLIGSIGFTSVLIIFSPDDKKVIICDIIEPLAAPISVGLSILVICRQKTDGLMGKTYTFLGVGLALFKLQK